MMDRAVSGARSRISIGMEEGLLTDQRQDFMKSSFPSSPSMQKDLIPLCSQSISVLRRFRCPWLLCWRVCSGCWLRGTSSFQGSFLFPSEELVAIGTEFLATLTLSFPRLFPAGLFCSRRAAATAFATLSVRFSPSGLISIAAAACCASSFFFSSSLESLADFIQVKSQLLATREGTSSFAEANSDLKNPGMAIPWPEPSSSVNFPRAFLRLAQSLSNSLKQ